MPRRYFHRHWIKPHFDSLRSFIKYKNWWRRNQLRRHEAKPNLHLSSYLSSHLSKPELDLSSHLNRDLNYHLNLRQIPETEHQLDISDR